MEGGTFQGKVSCKGYDEGAFFFTVNPDEIDEEVLLISLIPSHGDLRLEIRGSLRVSRKKAVRQTFYYTADCELYRKRLSAKIEKNSQRIRLHTYGDDSLEGRKFAMERSEGIYTLGAFDYVDLQYKLSHGAAGEVESGEPAYLLFDGQTDEKGQFSVVLPRFISEEGSDLIFFSEKKNCRIHLDFENMPKEIKVEL